MGTQPEKIKQIIPHSRPTLGQEESDQVLEAIRSVQLSQGERVHMFEQTFADSMGMKHASATSSGTAALHVTLLALGVGVADEVIIPSYVCTALLNAVRYVGATPVLADIDQDTGNLDPLDVNKRLTRRTKAVIIPHMFGLAADMDRLTKLDVPIIEDCAQTVGGTYGGKRVGTFGHAAIFSFYATKVMTTGEGGMVVSYSRKLIERVKDLREYDERREDDVRYNYKMTDIHAALGLAQLTKLETFIRRRRSIAKQYDQAFKDLGFKLPPNKIGHIYYRYVIGLDSAASFLIQRLQAKGIMCAKPVFKPLHRYLKQKGYPKTENVWHRSISLPIYPSLQSVDVNLVISTIKKVCKTIKKQGGACLNFTS